MRFKPIGHMVLGKSRIKLIRSLMRFDKQLILQSVTYPWKEAFYRDTALQRYTNIKE